MAEVIMKKTIIIVLFLCIALMLCACNKQKIENENSTPKESLNEKDNSGIIMPSNVERKTLTISSIDQYRELIYSGILPSDFVPYEKLKPLGEFVNLVFLSDAYLNDFSSYMYSLVDSSGSELTLYVETKAPTESVDLNIVTDVNITNMRSLSSKSTGIFTTNGLDYTYVSGELLSITWVEKGIYFTFCGNMFLSNYPLTDATFAGKMLNANNAVNTLNKVFKIAD